MNQDINFHILSVAYRKQHRILALRKNAPKGTLEPLQALSITLLMYFF
jgi:hypothetical protein